jgi:hypothetical protein
MGRRKRIRIFAVAIGAAVLAAGALVATQSAFAAVSNPGAISVQFGCPAVSPPAGCVGSLALNGTTPVVIDGINGTGTGTIAADGAINLLQANLTFAPFNITVASVIPAVVTIQPTTDWTGNLDPGTGVLTIVGGLTAHLADPSGGTPFLGTDCPVGPLSLHLTTGTSGAATGTPYSTGTGMGKVVDNTFGIPATPDPNPTCTGATLLNVNAPLPLAPGLSTTTLTALFSPKPLSGTTSSSSSTTTTTASTTSTSTTTSTTTTTTTIPTTTTSTSTTTTTIPGTTTTTTTVPPPPQTCDLGLGQPQPPPKPPKYLGLVKVSPGLTATPTLKDAKFKYSGSLTNCSGFTTATKFGTPISGGTFKMQVELPPGATCSNLVTGMPVKTKLQIKFAALKDGKLKTASNEKTTLTSYMQVGSSFPLHFLAVGAPFTDLKSLFLGKHATLNVTIDENAASVAALCVANGGLKALHFTGVSGPSTVLIS